jgi:hypothetical protein
MLYSKKELVTGRALKRVIDMLYSSENGLQVEL